MTHDLSHPSRTSHCQLWQRGCRDDARGRRSRHTPTTTTTRARTTTRATTTTIPSFAEPERFYDAVSETVAATTGDETTTEFVMGEKKMKTKTTTAAPIAPTTTPLDAISETTTTTTTTTSELKQLGFVRDATQSGVKYVSEHALAAKAAAAYSAARDATPLKGSLTMIESLLMQYGAPVAKKVVETAPVALAEADARVDYAVKALGETYDARVKNSAPMRTANAAYAYAIKAKERYPENLETLKTARAEYLAKIESTLENLKASAVKLPEEIASALRTAISQARDALDSDKLFARVKNLWEQVITNPRVVAVVNRATPVAERVLAQPAVSKAIAAATPYCTAIGKRVLPKPIAA